MAIIARDTFIRSNQTGLGTGSDGNVWSVSAGAATFSIVSNQGKATGDAQGRNVVLYGSTTSGDTEVLIHFKASTSDDLFGVTLRKQSGAVTYYRIAYWGYAGHYLNLTSNVANGGTTSFATGAFTVTANTYYWLRARVTGAVTPVLSGKIWADSTTEPVAWTVQASDTSGSPITGAGQFGLTLAVNLAGDTINFDTMQVTDTLVARKVTRNHRAVGRIA